MATTPPKPGSKALAALDALLAGVLPASAEPLRACDLCGSPELCARCLPDQRSE